MAGFLDGIGDFFGSVGRGIGRAVSSPAGQAIGGALAGIGVEFARQKLLGPTQPIINAQGRPRSDDVAVIQQRTSILTTPSLAGGPVFGSLGPLQLQGFAQSVPRTSAPPVPVQEGGLGGVLPGIVGGVLGDILSERIFGGGGDVATLPGGHQTGGAVGLPGGAVPLFNLSMGGRAHARSLVMALNPMTGTPTFFRHVGRPLIYQGDLTTCKRVRKVARLAKRSGG